MPVCSKSTLPSARISLPIVRMTLANAFSDAPETRARMTGPRSARPRRTAFIAKSAAKSSATATPSDSQTLPMNGAST